MKGDLESVVGHTVVSVKVDGDEAVIRTVGGGTLLLRLDGDCCSHSYFTKDAQFEDLIGAKILSAEEVWEESGFAPYNEDSSWATYKWHFLKFATDKGYVTIDWRNESNGYYDGSLTVRFEDGPDLPHAKDIFRVGMDETDMAVWKDYCADHGVEG